MPATLILPVDVQRVIVTEALAVENPIIPPALIRQVHSGGGFMNYPRARHLHPFKAIPCT